MPDRLSRFGDSPEPVPSEREWLEGLRPEDRDACPSSREAIWDHNEFDCPLCGRPAEEHAPEPPDDEEGAWWSEDEELAT
jgi:hypothetical protein